MAAGDTLAILNSQIIACNLCQRLRAHCTQVAEVRRRAYADWEYWGRPVPSFGDPEARVLALGLAPGLIFNVTGSATEHLVAAYNAVAR